MHAASNFAFVCRWWALPRLGPAFDADCAGSDGRWAAEEKIRMAHAPLLLGHGALHALSSHGFAKLALGPTSRPTKDQVHAVRSKVPPVRSSCASGLRQHQSSGSRLHFATKDACLEHVMQTRFGQGVSCQRCVGVSLWHRVHLFQGSCDAGQMQDIRHADIPARLILLGLCKRRSLHPPLP